MRDRLVLNVYPHYSVYEAHWFHPERRSTREGLGKLGLQSILTQRRETQTQDWSPGRWFIRTRPDPLTGLRLKVHQERPPPGPIRRESQTPPGPIRRSLRPSWSNQERVSDPSWSHQEGSQTLLVRSVLLLPHHFTALL